MKLAFVIFLWMSPTIWCEEKTEDESDKASNVTSAIVTVALPLIEDELIGLQWYSEHRKNFTLRAIPYFERYSVKFIPSHYNMIMAQVLTGDTEINALTSEMYQKILNGIWSISINRSNQRVQQFEQCVGREMDDLRSEKVRDWAKGLIKENEKQLDLALDAVRRLITAWETDRITIEAVYIQCAANVFLTINQYHSDRKYCYYRSPFVECRQKCYYLENTPFCTRSWKSHNSSTHEIKDIMRDLIESYRDEDDEETEVEKVPYVTEEYYHYQQDHLDLLSSFYFNLRRNVTEVWEAVENQKYVIKLLKDGYPPQNPKEYGIDFDYLPEISEEDEALGRLLVECAVNRRKPNFQQYFYDRLHCKNPIYVSGMLLVGNIVDEYNFARVVLQCYADIEENVFNKYAEPLTEKVIPKRIRPGRKYE